MPDPDRPELPDNVACKACAKELPLDEAEREEALDYVMYFCGLECAERWRQEHYAKDPAGPRSKNG